MHQTVMCIDLLAKHEDHGYEALFQAFKSKNINHTKFLDYNPDLNIKTGDIVVFVGGYDSNVEFKSKVLGFNEEGFAFVLWDCYWMAIDLNKRLCKK